jgi:hypothetical protein
MKAQVAFGTIIVVALFAGAATGADVNGKWVADVLTRMGGSQRTTFTFKVDGSKLTGTVATRTGEREITEGKASRDGISFAVVERMRDMEQKTVYQGNVTGDEIQFAAQLQMPPGGMGGFIPGPPMEFTAKREK